MLIRSPLRYPGGKSRAVRTVLGMLPPGVKTLASPFFGGGSVELAASAMGIRVHGYDAFEPLAVFWQEALRRPVALAKEVERHFPLAKADFYAMQKTLRTEQLGRQQTAAMFYALNRSSYSGSTLSGGMSPGHGRFTESAIARIRDFRAPNVSVELAEFADSIPRHADDFLYCDPPYAINWGLYGRHGDCHRGFDHAALAKLLTGRDGWVLSYNDCELVRDLYSGFEFVPARWAYGMNIDKKSNEVIILGKDLRKLAA